MSKIIWNTESGSLGVVRQSAYYEFALSAADSGGANLEYSHISGTLPRGLQVTTSGLVKGVPAVVGIVAGKSVTHTFTVRANTPAGLVADRTFSIMVTDISLLQIIPRRIYISTFDNGQPTEYQFKAVTDNPASQLSWSIPSGSAPIDVRTGKPMTISSTGVFGGYPAKIVDTSSGLPGYDNEPEDEFPYDFSATIIDEAISFNVQVTDGVNFDTVPVTITLVNKSHYTADNNVTSVNSTSATVDADSLYPPVIITDPATIPVLSAGNRFAFQFRAVDVQGDATSWKTESGLPQGLTINPTTGWLTGIIPNQTETQKVYTFSVTAYKRDKAKVTSLPMVVNIIVMKDITNYITWTTPAVAGILVNGDVSELTLTAVNSLGKPLSYTLDPVEKQKLPPGLTLLPTGDIVGRTSFRYFSLDANTSRVTVMDTAGIELGMAIEAVGAASGCTVTQIVDANTVVVQPAVYLVAGNDITFSNLVTNTNIITTVTDLSTATVLDLGKTTFDSTYKFTATAHAVDQSVTATAEFSIVINNYNRAPYENVYLKAMPSVDQRQTFVDIMSRQDIFPAELVYRSQDPWFGLAKDIRMLFLPGLALSLIHI